MLPTNISEVNRLDFQHYMLRYALRGNYATPRHHPLSILDVACGTGRWATDMATLYPGANVIGLDITQPPIETTQSERRPDNFSFVQGNLIEGLPFAASTFDFTHQRLLIAALPTENGYQRRGSYCASQSLAAGSSSSRVISSRVALGCAY